MPSAPTLLGHQDREVGRSPNGPVTLVGGDLGWGFNPGSAPVDSYNGKGPWSGPTTHAGEWPEIHTTNTPQPPEPGAQTKGL